MPRGDGLLMVIWRVHSVEEVQLRGDGLEALIFTAEGDMRAALNNLQSTATGFGIVTRENVFKVTSGGSRGVSVGDYDRYAINHNPVSSNRRRWTV